MAGAVHMAGVVHSKLVGVGVHNQVASEDKVLAVPVDRDLLHNSRVAFAVPLVGTVLESGNLNRVVLWQGHRLEMDKGMSPRFSVQVLVVLSMVEVVQFVKQMAY